MASLIWDTSFISSKRDFKFRVKMSDGSNMADSDEGVDFINIVNTQDFSKIDLGEYNTFRYSLGLGYIDYNYDEFWLAAEEYYAQDWIVFNPHRFASLGGGVGMASGYGVSQMPFSSTFFGMKESLELELEIISEDLLPETITAQQITGIQKIIE